jgi:hypothetical protein
VAHLESVLSEAVASGDEMLAEAAKEVSARAVGHQRFGIVTALQQSRIGRAALRVSCGCESAACRCDAARVARGDPVGAARTLCARARLVSSGTNRPASDAERDREGDEAEEWALCRRRDARLARRWRGAARAYRARLDFCVLE